MDDKSYWRLLKLVKTELLASVAPAQEAKMTKEQTRIGFELTPMLAEGEWGVWQDARPQAWKGERLSPEAVKRWERVEPELHFYATLVLKQMILSSRAAWTEFYETDRLLDQFGDVRRMLPEVPAIWIGKETEAVRELGWSWGS